jgi:phosphopantetheine--protein transferase-like protein
MGTSFDCRTMPVFNVSHSGDVLAIALCATGEIGVDVEQTNIQPGIDIEEIAKSHLAIDEYFLLMSLLPQQRLDYFLRIWTLKEAVLKAIGVGLYHPLNQINVAEPAVRYLILLKNAGKNIHLEAEHFQSRVMSFHVAVARVVALGVVSIFDNMLEGEYASELISFEHKHRTAVTGSQK